MPEEVVILGGLQFDTIHDLLEHVPGQVGDCLLPEHVQRTRHVTVILERRSRISARR